MHGHVLIGYGSNLRALLSSYVGVKSVRVWVILVGRLCFVLFILVSVLIGCGERSSSPDTQIRPAEQREVTIQATAIPTPTVDDNLSGFHFGIGGETSDLFQLAQGRYVLLLEVTGNDRFLAPDTWRIELFRILEDVVLLDRSGRGVSGRSSGGFLIENAAWELWFRLNVGDDARWTVTLRRVGDLPSTTPIPQAKAQTTEDPQPTPALRVAQTETPTRGSTAPLTPAPQPTPAPASKPTLTEAPTRASTPPLSPTPQPTSTPQTFQSCQEIPEPLIVVDTQGRRAVPRDLVPSAPDGDNDGFACGGQLGLAPTPTPEPKRAPPPTPAPQVFQSCQDVPESLVVVDTQGRRAVPRNLVPSAPDGDNDGFACGGQLELAPTQASTQRIETLRNAVSLEFTLTMLPSIQTAAAYAEQRDWRRSGDYMELAAGSCDLARDAVAEIARLSAESVWDSVASHLSRACRAYWSVARALHSGNIDAAARSLDTATTALQRATGLVPFF